MYMKKISIVVILLISIVGSGLAQTKKPADPKKTSTKSTSKKAAPEPKHTLVYGNNVPKEQQQMVEISTSYGVMVVKLYKFCYILQILMNMNLLIY